MHKKKQSKGKQNKNLNTQKPPRKAKTRHPNTESDSDASLDSETEANRFEEIQMASYSKSEKNEKDVVGFSDDSDQEMRDTQKMMIQQNRKNKKSGGFQSMGLSHTVLKGITRNGYKIPTPIQRKTIPLIRDGKDVVAMARTGSGKTAAFLIPMFERLKTHMAKHGARALIMSPTRELALQTLKFTKKIGKFTGLRSTAVLGGDRMEDQFESLHENPDIIIATPGRFMHVVVQMNLKLQSVEYVVFDEADRLFEMGFQEQLTEILQRLPEARQTLLFSATLPKLLVEFAKAGLHDPTLLRLDVDTKLSENLKLSFLQCRADDKLAVLLHLMRCVVKPSQQTVVFVATKHHVEYLKSMLEEVNINCSYIYSSLDQTARKINIAKFSRKQTMVLLVTDLAARGIDIPMLDNVINYNFPAKPKLFVHRVGRVARAGRSGVAYSLVSPDELPFVLDLHLFLGRPVKYAKPNSDKDEDSLIGRVPQSVVDEDTNLQQNVSKSVQIQNLARVCNNAHKQYITSRPAPSSESVKRMKSHRNCPVAVHPMFETIEGGTSAEREDLLVSMRNYKPNATIFEINSTSKKKGVGVMRLKRKYHEDVIQRNQVKVQEKNEEFLHGEDADQSEPQMGESVQADEDTIQETFAKVVAPKYRENTEPKKKKRKKAVQDENYLHYRPTDYRSEMGLSISRSFEQDTAEAVLDLTADDDKDARKMKNQVKKWDRKKKKFVQVDSDQKNKRVKTESGAWISASYKTNIYSDWLEKNKVLEREDNDSDADNSERNRRFQHRGKKGRFYTNKEDKKGSHREMKNKEQILKARRKKSKLQAFQKKRQQIKNKRRSMSGRGK